MYHRVETSVSIHITITTIRTIMANRADSTVKICTANKSVAEQLWSNLQKLNINSKDVYLCDLAEAYNIDCEKRKISVRGFIYSAEYEQDDEVEDYIISLYIDSAWTLPLDFLYALNEATEDQLSISYRCIEPGCMIYEVHDERNFFPEECVVDCDGEPFLEEDADVYETIGEAIQIWCDRTGESLEGRTTEQMIEFINGYEYSDPDTFFYLNEFEFE